ncbi:hypothetical protein VTN31DRAFT_6633 [Thermomyces dupontii]|uniref:uncharacterized protein n=1 Tax=Talaromyces thermophilus TaxID=28565 RepID=UPI003742895D
MGCCSCASILPRTQPHVVNRRWGEKDSTKINFVASGVCAASLIPHAPLSFFQILPFSNMMTFVSLRRGLPFPQDFEVSRAGRDKLHCASDEQKLL